VHVQPINPMLKAPGSRRLKLEHEGLPSSFGFNLNLRRSTEVAATLAWVAAAGARQGLTLVHCSAQPEPFLTQNVPHNPLIHP